MEFAPFALRIFDIDKSSFGFIDLNRAYICSDVVEGLLGHSIKIVGDIKARKWVYR